MRITNQMLTNTSMHNINRNKNSLSILDQQYSSGKKIQRPSEDPIIAVRALKLRTNLSELNQYYEKNIPDAKSWMDVTESALNNINTILTNINSSFVQGANDPLTPADRTSIMQNLVEYKKQIYQEGNSNYAGRYVFTGYKTDKSLVFNESTTDLKYSIKEKFTGKDIETISKVVGTQDIDKYNPADPAPTLTNTYRIRLSYNDLKDTPINDISYTYVDDTGVTQTVNITPVSKNKDDADAYSPGAGQINFIAETGELILSDDMYENLRVVTDINFGYDKHKFNEGDLRPEHYFDCTVIDKYNKESKYEKSDQYIQYEINFNQKLVVNTQGSDALVHGIARDIDEVVAVVYEVTETEENIAEVKKRLEDKNVTPDEAEKLNALLGQLDTELVLKNKLLHDKFSQGIAGSSKHQNTINTAVADLGSRYVRLELTEDRLSNQQVDFEDLLSTNEDVDIVETFIKLSSKEAIYNASLSAASKVIKNTLLDFI